MYNKTFYFNIHILVCPDIFWNLCVSIMSLDRSLLFPSQLSGAVREQSGFDEGV